MGVGGRGAAWRSIREILILNQKQNFNLGILKLYNTEMLDF
jgi:hypothetical protein